MYAASVHDAFAIEELQVGGDEDSVFLHCFVADVLTVLRVYLDAIDFVILKDFAQFLKVAIHDETVRLPHRSSELVVCDQLKVVSDSRSSKGISVSLTLSFFVVTTFVKVLFLTAFSLFDVNSLFFSVSCL